MQYENITMPLLAAISLAIPMVAEGSEASQGNFLKSRGTALAPFAFIEFCRRAPDQCRPKSGPAEVTLTPETFKKIEAINQSVNARIRPVDEAPKADRWTLDPVYGDCDDYAVSKRRQLMRRGMPSRAVRIAVGRVADGTSHAVVVVRTTEGDLVLDNRTDKPNLLKDADIAWSKMESDKDPKQWKQL